MSEDPLSSDYKPTPIDVARVEGLTQPGLGTNIGPRTEDLNDQYKKSSWYRKLRKQASREDWTREQLDEAVRAHGVR